VVTRWGEIIMRLIRMAVGTLAGVFLSCAGAAAWADASPALADAGVAGGDAFAAMGKPVSSARLGELRGGAEDLNLTFNNMRVSGTTSNNVATNVQTGSNLIDGGSFANASGLPTLIQNSGANVLIQNATLLNIQFKP